MTTASTIDTLCSGCGKHLRVAAEYAGKKARCPHCQLVYTVPAESRVTMAGNERLSPPGVTGETWQVRSPEGLVYGPVSKAELDRWRDEGRITHQSQLLPAGGQQWMWGTDVYPQLALAKPMTPVSGPLAAAGGVPSPQQGLHPFYADGIQPHRGVLVLVASVLGIATLCAVPSVMGLILGIYDLRLMSLGKMDRRGRGMTIVGVVLSAFWTLANVVVIVGVIVMTIMQ